MKDVAKVKDAAFKHIVGAEGPWSFSRDKTEQSGVLEENKQLLHIAPSPHIVVGNSLFPQDLPDLSSWFWVWCQWCTVSWSKPKKLSSERTCDHLTHRNRVYWSLRTLFTASSSSSTDLVDVQQREDLPRSLSMLSWSKFWRSLV